MAQTWKVQLYLYDLTNGLAATLGPSLIGRPLEAIWHSSIVVYQTEFYFGNGLFTSQPGRTHFGAPRKIIDLGETSIPKDLFFDYLKEIAGKYGPMKYHLLDNNCNHFTSDVSQFLVGRDIPPEVVNQPQELIRTPIGMMMRPMIEQMFGPSSIPAEAPINFSQDLPAPQNLSANPPSGSAHPSHPIPTSNAHPHTRLNLKYLKPTSPSVYLTGQVVTIFTKLKTFLQEENLTLNSNPDSLATLDKALKSAFNTKTLRLSEDVYQYLEELLEKFPTAKAFPMLDILRLVFGFDHSSILRYTKNDSNLNLIKLIQKFANNLDFSSNKPTVIMALRLACNAFLIKEGSEFLMSTNHNLGVTIEVTVKGLLSGDKMIRETASSLAFNLAVSNLKEADPVIEIVSALNQALIEESDYEVAFRILSSLARFMYCDNVIIDLLNSLQLDEVVAKLTIDDPATNPLKTSPEAKEKLRDVCSEVLLLLKTF